MLSLVGTDCCVTKRRALEKFNNVNVELTSSYSLLLLLFFVVVVVMIIII